VAPLLKVSALPSKEELPACFEVKARILDFYPITLDEGNCLLRVCGDCNKLSVPRVVFPGPVMFSVSLKDRKNCRVVSRLFDHDTPSTCDIPLLAFIHVGYGERGRARGNCWKH
jgi:hypothetical protein